MIPGSAAWNSVRLGDILRVKHGFAFSGEFFSDRGDYLVVTPGNFRESGGFKHKSGKEKFYSADAPVQYVLTKGDLVIAMTEQAEGLLGSSGLIPEDGKYLHNQRIGLVDVFRSDRVDKRFLYYLFNTNRVRSQIQATATGSKVRHTAPARIEAVEVFLPPLSKQRRIASTLSAYDDLIENNTRRIQILEAMAQAIYREWFVEFRFPGHEDVRMVESALGPIPEGWRAGPLADALNVSRNVINPSDVPQERFALYSFSAFDAGRAPAAELGAAIQSSKFLIAEPCVLYAKLNPRIPRVWFVDPDLELRALASSEFLVILPKEPWGLALSYSVLRSPEFASRAVSRAAGTSTSHQRIRPSDLLSMVFAHPSPTLCRAFEQAVGPMLALGDRLRRASHNLRATRDLLLPRLISGEIDVSDLDLGGAEPAA